MVEKGPGSWIRVIAEGIVSGEVPEVKTPGIYPSCDYTDNIGGEVRIRI